MGFRLATLPGMPLIQRVSGEFAVVVLPCPDRPDSLKGGQSREALVPLIADGWSVAHVLVGQDDMVLVLHDPDRPLKDDVAAVLDNL